MAATLIRQTIREESPLIIHAATEAASVSAASSSAAAVGSMAANAARTAAVASVEAASATTTSGLLGGVTAGAGRIGSEAMAKEVGAVGGGKSTFTLLEVLCRRNFPGVRRPVPERCSERPLDVISLSSLCAQYRRTERDVQSLVLLWDALHETLRKHSFRHPLSSKRYTRCTALPLPSRNANSSLFSFVIQKHPSLHLISP